MSQVHRYDEFVIKFNHPEVKGLLHEINVLKFWIRVCSFLSFTWLELISHIEWDSFFEMLIQQIDLRNEARNMKRFHDIYQDHPFIHIPKMIEATKDYIIMTYCPGVPLYTYEKTDLIYQQSYQLVMSSFLHMGSTHQFMHADLHSANILVSDHGIYLIDFGICNELSVKQLTSILSIQQYEANPEYTTISNMLSVMIRPTPKKKQLIEEVYQKYCLLFLDTKEPISFTTLFSVMIEIVRKHNVFIRGEIFSYLSTLFLLEEMSPFDKPQYSTYQALMYMKNHPFFIKECGNDLDYYLRILSKKFEKNEKK